MITRSILSVVVACACLGVALLQGCGGAASAKPMHNLTLHADLHAFWLADRGDALYNAGGGVLRAGDAAASREVGQELDLMVRYSPRPRIAVEAGWSYFRAGDFISDTGADSDTRFAYASFQWTF